MTAEGPGSVGGDHAIEEVLGMAAEWERVLIANDPEEVGRFMTDGWVYIGPDGAVTKAEVIGWIRDGRLAHHSMTSVGPPRVRRLGDTVIVTARKRSSGTWEGAEYVADEWITEMYVQTAQGWLCAFSQKTDASSTVS